MTHTSHARYVFDTAERVQKERLEAQSALWDPFTFRKLDEIGVTTGWQCLEIGAGTGSVAAWLADRVGPTGQVVATDIETHWLEPIISSNLQVRYHNVAGDPLEDEGYDLIHARLVLQHVPQRDTVAAKLANALRPGGWLVIEDHDLHTIPVANPTHPAWATVNNAVISVLQAAGADPHYGRKLLTALQSIGLIDISAEGLVRPQLVPEFAPALLPLLQRMREPMLSSGAVSPAEFDQAVAAFDDTAMSAYSPILVSARGRRAGSDRTGGIRCHR